MKPYIKFIIAIAIPLSVGIISGFFTSASVAGWFTSIKKPSFNPPNWVFAPVWTTLYCLMGIAFFIVWNKAQVFYLLKRNAIIFYSIQLLLNFLWSIIFFEIHQPGWALCDIVLLWIMILLTINSFRKISLPAALLLIPYILWVSFATVLDYAIWELN